MKKIDELKQNPISITNDEELEAWKSTWDGKSCPPPGVHRYMIGVVLPREERLLKELNRWMSNKS